jgi:hypothetical protein
MIPLLGALHAIAAQRGDGLRPELLRLLAQPEAGAEAKCTSPSWSEPEGGHVFPTRSDCSPFASGSMPKGVLRLPSKSK